MAEINPEDSSPIRIVLTSVPKSGNTWLRNLWDVATGIASESVYEEYGQWSAFSNSYGSRFGSNGGRDHFTNNTIAYIHRATTKEPILIKTHFPFLHPHDDRYSKDGSILILLVRHLVSTYSSMFNHSWIEPETRLACAQGFHKFAEKWLYHKKFWQEHASEQGIPFLQISYETLVGNPEDTFCELVLEINQALPDMQPVVLHNLPMALKYFPPLAPLPIDWSQLTATEKRWFHDHETQLMLLK